MGLRGKRGPDRSNIGWIRDTIIGTAKIQGLYTYDQLRKDWDAIGPERRIATVAAWVPKEIKAESGISVTLNITGLDKPHEIAGEIIEPKQLEAHQDDDD